MSPVGKPSVALLTNAPAPYRTPFLNQLSKRYRLLVAFDTKRLPSREWDLDEQDFEFEWTLTRSLMIPRPIAQNGFRRVLHVPLNVASVLKRFQPDVVISDGLGVRTASAAGYCRLHSRPLIIWWEGTPHTERETGASRLAIRRVLLRGATRTWGNGQESAACLEAYGVPRSRIDLGMTGADTVRWSAEVQGARGAASSAIREQYGLRGFVLLFVGRLTTLKGIPELLAALSEVARDRDLPPWSALLLGSGPLGPDVTDWARRHPEVPVALAGFIQPSELANYYAAADLFVMPSLLDRWSLVCLDAVVAGVPQVTSSLNGGAVDLITSPEVGDIVDPRDTRSLAAHIAHRIRLGPTVVPEAMRDRVRSDWSPESMTNRAVSSIEQAVIGSLGSQATRRTRRSVRRKQ